MNAREVALAVVRDVFPAPGDAVAARTAQEALDYRARKANLDPRDRAFATELAYGSIKMRRALDWYLRTFVGGRTQPLPIVISEIVRLAAYELVYTQADEHATVFEFVNLAKRHGHRGLANLVNAVLRTFLRERPADPQRDAFTSDVEYLGTRYSLPSWIVRQWIATFGDGAEAVCAAVNAPATAAVTVNTVMGTREGAEEALLERGVTTRPSAFVEESLVVAGAQTGGVRAAEAGANGAWWVQSESSAMPVAVLNPQLGEAALDVCSGRGNKALQIAARLGAGGSLTCIERDAKKASMLVERLETGGFAAATVIGDATTELLAPGQRFDRVLLDAPCSGIGVIGRHPEARWKKLETDGERLSATQRALLEQSALHVHPGGTLVYAVCSTDPRETTGVVAAFLARNNFERGLLPAVFESFLTAENDLIVPPGIEGRDGFFIARLERRP
jgi:16S rRNA (cytosine967-C5)-methyltransferase